MIFSCAPWAFLWRVWLSPPVFVWRRQCQNGGSCGASCLFTTLAPCDTAFRRIAAKSKLTLGAAMGSLNTRRQAMAYYTKPKGAYFQASRSNTKRRSAIYRPGRLGRAKPRAGPESCAGCTSSFRRSPVISSGPEASICHCSEALAILHDCIHP